MVGFDDDVALFAANNLGVVLFPPYTTIGLSDESGALKGAAVYREFTGTSAEITLYAPGMMKKGILQTVLRYPFNELGVLGLLARTKRSNTDMCRMLPQVGFKYKATLENHFGPERGDDAILFRIDRTGAAKWL